MRTDLLAADYTVDGVEELLGPSAVAALHRDQLAPAAWSLDAAGLGDDPLATLIRLFLFGQRVDADRVAAAVPSTGLQGFAELGLVEITGSSVRAVVDVRPYQEDEGKPWWVVSDHGEEVLGGPLPTDHVLGIGQASLTVVGATIRRRVSSALDLGTGCGVQALHLTRHADRVVATDVSTRALALARLGVGLSDVRVELRHGSLFDPVQRERFDLIVANPPFVITPRVAGVPEYTYRDGGRTGDEIVRSLVTGAGRHLRPGGIAQLLGNWEIGRDQTWSDPLTAWLEETVDEEGHPLDAWIVQRELLDPADYAVLWSRDGGATGPEQDRLIRAWLDDFAARGVQLIGLGLITLRRPGDGTAPLRRLEYRPESVTGQLGAHLDSCLRNHDALGRSSLTDARLTVAPDVVEVREHRPGESEPTRILLRQTAGFGRQIVLDPAMTAFVGACDGELTFGQIAGAIGQLLDHPVADVTREMEFTARELVLAGFLSVTVEPLERRGGSAHPPDVVDDRGSATVLPVGSAVHGGQVRKPR